MKGEERVETSEVVSGRQGKLPCDARRVLQRGSGDWLGRGEGRALLCAAGPPRQRHVSWCSSTRQRARPVTAQLPSRSGQLPDGGPCSSLAFRQGLAAGGGADGEGVRGVAVVGGAAAGGED